MPPSISPKICPLLKFTQNWGSPALNFALIIVSPNAALQTNPKLADETHSLRRRRLQVMYVNKAIKISRKEFKVMYELMAPRKTVLRRAYSKKGTKRSRQTQEPLVVGEGSIAGAEGEITTSEPPKKKGRGPRIIRRSTEILEDRPIIWPISDRAFTCKSRPQEITAAITRLVLNHMPGPLRSFHAFDNTTKNNIEFIFLKKFRYREDEDPLHCRNVLYAIAAKRYTEELHEARDSCLKKFGNNKQAWKTCIPHWCLDHNNWHGLCDIFATEEWQGLSKTNKVNRTKTGPKISHHGGSASAHQHLEKLTELNNGKQPPMRALFIHLHCAKENGKSPIVAQMEAAAAAAAVTAAAAAVESGPADLNEANGVIDPSTTEANTQLEALDIASLHFTNEQTQSVYASGNLYIYLLKCHTLVHYFK
ncbi:Plant transposase (Ptta/En/Spm family) [Carex littledalei]|uniref:Plant transposase (Ptta/En/Spm family) n=1 Tax=Carex littledalei TaxID=544730 RepID=A0A833QXA9_9POAL|nr:Plant transposase (Ptta/En/Spm family) [Carex littledalei]